MLSVWETVKTFTGKKDKMNRWKIRAAQIDLARQKENLDFIKSFIDFIARYGYNTLLLYLEGKVRTKTFPYPSPEKSYSPEEMKGVVSYARKKKIDVIPAVSNLGHTEHFLRYAQLKHIAELREGIPGRFGNSTLGVTCPSLDETYEFFESYFAEIAEIFPSPYFHVGCDESWDMGFCSLCRARAKQKGEYSLFTEHLLRTHRFVTGKLKKRMMMWDDMFEAYPESLRAIPRDIIMCSWFYDPVFNIPRSHFYNRKQENVFRRYDKLGFQYLICPAEQSITNIISCTGYARKYKPLGGLVTSWEKSTGFLYKSYPAFAFAGLLWSTEQNEEAIMKKVCRNLFASESPSLVDAINLYLRRIPWPKFRLSSSFASGISSLAEQSRKAETQLLTDIIKNVKVAGDTTGTRVLEDIRTDLDDETSQHALRTLIPQFYKASVLSLPQDAVVRSINRSVKKLRKLAKMRARHWRQWRKGISPDNASASLNRSADSYEKLLAAKKSYGLLNIYGFLPDMYAAPKTKLSLWNTKARRWQEVFNGSTKPHMDSETYYQVSIPIYKPLGFSKIRIDVWNYGGQGFRFLELLTKKGRFIPEKIESASGIVRDPEHIISDDYRWTYLGETDVYKTYHNRRLAATVHSITLSLKKETQ
jgi:hypothetical protein